jgi:hypothetical protein
MEPGATVVTDGWSGYNGIGTLGYVHEPHSQRAVAAAGEDVAALLPGVHRVASLAKRSHLGTHQGRVDAAHLQSYLDDLLRWPETSATSVGALDRQWRPAPLEVTAILHSPRFSLFASGRMDISGSADAEVPTSVKQQPFLGDRFERSQLCRKPCQDSGGADHVGDCHSRIAQSAGICKIGNDHRFLP